MSDRPDALMLFAAGFGTRMGALTATRPKPLIEVGGQPLIAHALAQAHGTPVSRRAANLHYLPDQLLPWLRQRNIEPLVESPGILETGGGLKAALPVLGTGPVFTLNTDAIWIGPPALATLAAAWDPATMDALVLTVPRDRAVGHSGMGDFVLAEDGRIARGPGDIYTGAQIIRTDRLRDIDETVFSLNRLWDMLLADGTAFGTRYPGHWCDVGRPEGIAAAEAMLERHGV